MKYELIVAICSLLTGCVVRYDARLNGTWHSNREATVAEAVRRDPRWLQAPPEKFERFSDIFGHMTVTYSNDVITSNFKDQLDIGHYRVVECGEDFVVIRIREGIRRDENIRIDFTDNRESYWIDVGLLPMREKFDKINAEPPRRATPATPTPDESRVASPASGVNGMEPGAERGASGASFGR